MSARELVIWSMALGAIGAVVLVALADVFVVRSAGAIQGATFHFSAFLFALLLSGVPKALDTELSRAWLQPAQVLIGPLCVALGDWWIRGWFGAHQRDRLMANALRGYALLAPIAGLLILALPYGQQLPAAAAICLLNSGLVLWLAVRGWLLGDRLALGIAAGCALMLPAMGGLYAIALGVPGVGAGLQAASALSAVLAVWVIGAMLWRRNRLEHRAAGLTPMSQDIDPVTKLLSGRALVQVLINALKRRRRTRRDGAILAVMVFNIESIQSTAGTSGLNEMLIHLAHRLGQQVGVVNTVGRYYDRCFVVLVETIHSMAWLRTMGLRVASGMRRPIEVRTPNGERVQVRPDIGVGVVHLSRSATEVEEVLHDAQSMAEAARGMQSRAAILDPASGDVTPVELASLGPRPRRQRRAMPHVESARSTTSGSTTS